jgi:hypothetical protein
MMVKINLFLLVGLVMTSGSLMGSNALNPEHCKTGVTWGLKETRAKKGYKCLITEDFADLMFKSCGVVKDDRERADCYLRMLEMELNYGKNLEDLNVDRIYGGCGRNRFFDKTLLEGAKVSGARLRSMDLKGIDLTDTDMNDAILTDRSLIRVTGKRR